MTDAPDSSKMSLGRCRNSRCRTLGGAWMWPRGTIRLTETVCPVCGVPLSQTTRDYRRAFVSLTAAQIVLMLNAAIARASQRLDGYQRLADKTADPFEADIRRSYAAGIAKDIKEMRARLGRARKLAAHEARKEA